MKITIKDCIMTDNQIGEKNNKIVYSDEKLSDNEWDIIKNVLDSRMKEMNNKDEISQLIEQAKEYADKKDEKSFGKFLKENVAGFSQNIFCNITSTMLYNILLKLGFKFMQ